jgi:hypothetical protein
MPYNNEKSYRINYDIPKAMEKDLRDMAKDKLTTIAHVARLILVEAMQKHKAEKKLHKSS